MKKLLIFALVIFFIPFAEASVFEIQVKNFAYVPAELTVQEGDTVKFVYVNGTHPTVSESGAWTSFTLNAASSTKSLILNSGVYNYYCELHGGPGGAGMSGKITVEPKSQTVSGTITEITKEASLYPNPANSEVTVSLNTIEADEISIVSAVGTELLNEKVQRGQSTIALNLASGEYIVLFKNKGMIVERKKLKVDRG